MTLDASGNLLVNSTATGTSNADGFTAEKYVGGIVGNFGHNGSAASNDSYINFRRNGSVLGSIYQYSSSGIGINSGGALSISTAGTERWQLSASGHWLAVTDATYDIGASGASRPRDAYISNSLVVKSSTGQFILGGTTSATYPSFSAANTGEFIYSADKHRFFNKTGATEKASFDMATGNATFTGKAGIGTTGTLVYQLEVQAASGADRDIVLAGVNGVTNGLTVKWNNTTSKTLVNIANIPTAAAGLPTGTLYNDAGTIKIA
jgi:hypothetical protein